MLRWRAESEAELAAKSRWRRSATTSGAPPSRCRRSAATCYTVVRLGRPLRLLAPRARAPRRRRRHPHRRAGRRRADRRAPPARAARRRPQGADRLGRRSCGAAPATPAPTSDALKALALDETLAALAARYPDRSLETRVPGRAAAGRRPRSARASAPGTSCFRARPSPEPGRHGTFARRRGAPALRRRSMGFDVLYLPPIHPIGRVKRKGRNNALVAEAGDVGSPWAIGAAEGGHKAILPELGTPRTSAAWSPRPPAIGIEIALDIAFQCAPDHPYVKAHPTGSAGGPTAPCSTPRTRRRSTRTSTRSTSRARTGAALWAELKSVFEHWIGEGVTIFRVDNPHTKAFPFWEWAIGEIKREHPDADLPRRGVHAAEGDAPAGQARLHAVLHLLHLAQHQARADRVLHRADARARVANTSGPTPGRTRPTSCTSTCRAARRPVFMVRLVLAATLAASYGIYGPAFELLEARRASPAARNTSTPRSTSCATGTSTSPDSLRALHRAGQPHPPRQPGAAGRPQPALPADRQRPADRLRQSVDDGDNIVVTVVNLDPHHVQSGWVELDLRRRSASTPASAVPDARPAHRRSASSGRGARNFVRLDPQRAPAHVFAACAGACAANATSTTSCEARRRP